MGEILEAVSDPKRAANFANRIGSLIKDSKVNERVREGCATLIQPFTR